MPCFYVIPVFSLTGAWLEEATFLTFGIYIGSFLWYFSAIYKNFLEFSHLIRS